MKADSPSTDPTERSTCRMTSTKVWPTAMSPVIAIATSRSKRPWSERNRGLTAVVTARTTSSAPATGASRPASTRRRPPFTPRSPRRATDRLAGRRAHDALLVGLGAVERGHQPALAHDEDAVGHAEHLGQLAGDHQDGDALPASSESRRCTSALVPTSMPRVGSSTISSRGLGGEPLGEHDLLLVAAGEQLDGLVEAARTRSCSRCAQSAASSRSARSRTTPDGRSAAEHDDRVLRAIEAGMTRPCWRRSSGTSATPAPSRPRGSAGGSGVPSHLDRPRRSGRCRRSPARPRCGRRRRGLRARRSRRPGRRSSTSSKTPVARQALDPQDDARRASVAVLGNSSVSSRPTIQRTTSPASVLATRQRVHGRAVAHDRDPVAEREDLLEPVADEDDGRAAVAQPAGDVEEPLDLRRGQRRGRLVHDDDPRLGATAPWRSRRSAGRRSTARAPAVGVELDAELGEQPRPRVRIGARRRRRGR